MPRQHKPHRGRNAWKKDILRLTCLLRLRCSPPVPYTVIADLLIRIKAKAIEHLFRLLGPEDWTSGNAQGFVGGLRCGTREWLVGYLQNIYEDAGREKPVHWEQVRDLDGESVREKIAELGGGPMGEMEDLGDAEFKLQRDWKSVDDWRAGSEPEPRTAPEQESKETVSPISGEQYSSWREQFFDDMVNNIVDDDASESKRRRVLSNAVGGPRMELFDDELVWRPPKFDSPNSFREILEEDYHKILAQLKEINEVINDCNWELSVIETGRLSPNTAESLQMTITLLPALGQPVCYDNSEGSISDTDEQYIAPRLIVEELESHFAGWQGYTDYDGDDTGPSPMMVVAEKAFKEWKSHGKTQAWLEMSR